MCIFLNCKISPNFNIVGNTKRLYCSTHKLDGMVSVSSKKCGYLNCDVRPSFNFEGLPAKYCLQCKENDMIDVFHKKCKTQIKTTLLPQL